MLPISFPRIRRRVCTVAAAGTRATASLLVIVGTCALGAQTLPPAANTGSISPLPTAAEIPTTLQPDLAAPEVPDTYQIGSDDLLTVFVFQMPEMTSQVRVNSAGTIRLPMVKQVIHAAGKTAPELADAVASELTREGMAHDPQVEVLVRQVMSRPIVVAGAVKYPLVLEAARPMRLTEALARAGGLQNDSGSALLLTSGPNSERVTRQIDLATLETTGDSDFDPLLTGGEVIRVLPARLVYAVGALQKPGAFPLQTGEPITVLRAIALAQGFSTTMAADKKHAEIVHVTAAGVRQETAVDLDKLLKHQVPDVELQAGDLFYVPENGRHKVLMAAVGDLSQAAVIAFGYNAAGIF